MRSHSNNFMLGNNNSGRSSDDEQLLGGPHAANSVGPQNPSRYFFPPIPQNLATAHNMAFRPPPSMVPHIGHLILPPVNPMPRPYLHQSQQHASVPFQAGLLELYSQIQEMDVRIRQLEMIVYNNNHQVNPIVMSAGSSLIANTSADSVEEPSMSNNSLHQEERMVQRGDLDRVCLPVLENHSHPPATALNEICRQLEPHFQIFRQELLSIIRRWFRKRREEMSQRIFNSCKRHFCNGSYSKNDLLNLADNIAKETALVDKIRTEANLEIANLTVANQFCIAKIESFLKRSAEENEEQSAD